MKGSTAIPIVMVVGAICTWCMGLSVALFNDHATLASLTTSVEDIKQTVHDIDNHTSYQSVNYLSVGTSSKK